MRGKIVIVRYGQNFRGVKAFVAQERGAAGVIIYSDPKDDGYFAATRIPRARGVPPAACSADPSSIMFQFPGDPTTPGFASSPICPTRKRISPDAIPTCRKFPSRRSPYADAEPILANLGGPDSPREWQGALPFTYHVGSGPAKVKLHLKQDYRTAPSGT